MIGHSSVPQKSELNQIGKLLRHTTLLKVNQANISLVVLDSYKSKLWDSEIKDKTKHLWLLTFKCEIILMLVISSRKILQLEEDRLQK